MTALGTAAGMSVAFGMTALAQSPPALADIDFLYHILNPLSADVGEASPALELVYTRRHTGSAGRKRLTAAHELSLPANG